MSAPNLPTAPAPGRRPRRVPGLFAAGLIGVAVPAAAADLGGVASRHFDPAFLAEARSYHDVRYVLWFAQAALTVTLLWLVAARIRGDRWARLVERLRGRAWAARALLSGALAGGVSLLALPFAGVRFALATGHGLRHDSPWAFLRDYAAAAGIDILLTAVVAVLVLGLFARVQRLWWTAAGGLLAVLAPLYVFGAPLLVDPIFNRITPMPASPLTEGILDIARRGGAPAGEVWISGASRRTRAVNAYLTGFGPSRRIVLYDTLVEKLTAGEVLQVVAHEVGHWRLGHLAWGTALGVLAATLGMAAAHPLLSRWAASPSRYAWRRSDPRLVFPAYALYLTAVVLATPATNLVSRRMERAADVSALELTGDRDAFIAGKVRAARENLADVAPPRWIEVLLFTHPAVARRIALAEARP